MKGCEGKKVNLRKGIEIKDKGKNRERKGYKGKYKKKKG